MTDDIGLSFARIPAGTFRMGLEIPAEEAAVRFGGEPDWYDPEQPRHIVHLTQPFDLATTLTTRGQFAAFVAATGYQTQAEVDGFAQHYNGEKFAKTPGLNWRNCGFKQTDEHPVVCVTYDDALAFCDWRTSVTGQSHRLPTEAEWEYAYRAGGERAYFWGDDPAAGVGHANCADVTSKAAFPGWLTFNWSTGFVYTSPVASFKPNPWGLYDLAGNAWEWCSNWHYPYTADERVDPTGPPTGEKRVLRGGAWFGAPLSSRAAYRSKISPGYRGSNVGFRVARNAERENEGGLTSVSP